MGYLPGADHRSGERTARLIPGSLGMPTEQEFNSFQVGYHTCLNALVISPLRFGLESSALSSLRLSLFTSNSDPS